MSSPSGQKERPASPNSKIKFVCRWAGEFKSDATGRTVYDGGETRLCTVPRAITLLQLTAKLKELTGFKEDFFLKYQLAGHLEDLVSLKTNEDLEAFKDEHDMLIDTMLSGQSTSGQRLRMFVLPKNGRARTTGDADAVAGPSSPLQALRSRSVTAQGANNTAAAASPRPEGLVRRIHSASSSDRHNRTSSNGSSGTPMSVTMAEADGAFNSGSSTQFGTSATSPTARGNGAQRAAGHMRTASFPATDAMMGSPRKEGGVRKQSSRTGASQWQDDEDASTSGEAGYGTSSSSDSEDGEFAASGRTRSGSRIAETLSEVTAVLGKQKSTNSNSLQDTADDEAIEKCLNEVEAALNAGLNFKGRFSSGMQVFGNEHSTDTTARDNFEEMLANELARDEMQIDQPKKKRVQIAVPNSHKDSMKPAGPAGKLGLRLQVGSAMLSSGAPEPVVEVPASLQQINSEDLEKLKELGRGQFGSVWLSKWLGVEVAVKELHGTHNSASSAEMYQEAETMAFLRHPCVIAFYGVVVGQESPASVIEFVRGGSLRGALQQLKAFKIFSRKVRALICLQAARGMEYLHSRRVVHFDLKCDNLLCDLRDLKRPVVKIGDLGLSKKKAATFVSGNMRGTLPWMAPELFPSMHSAPSDDKDPMMQEDRVTEKVDVFSFAVVMWEIWTLGEQPYPGMSLPEIFAGVMNGTLRPGRPVDCSKEWGDLMEACWTTHPSKRPTFSEVAERLEQIGTQFDDDADVNQYIFH